MFDIVYNKISRHWILLFFLLLIFLAIPSAFHALESESFKSNISTPAPLAVTTKLSKLESKPKPDSKAIVLASVTIKPLQRISKPLVTIPENKQQKKDTNIKQQSINISNFPVKGG